MIRKTARVYKRVAWSWENPDEDKQRHVEQVTEETWWLFGLIPVYSRETITGSNLTATL